MADRSLEDILEWVVLGLLIVVGVLVGFWLLGWAFYFVGKIFLGVAAFIVLLLKFLVPVLIIAGIVYLLVRWLGSPRTA